VARVLSIHRGTVERFEAFDGTTVESAIRKQAGAEPAARPGHRCAGSGPLGWPRFEIGHFG